MKTKVHFELEGLSVQDGQWRRIGSFHERRSGVRKIEREYRNWMESEGDKTGWTDFRVVKVSTKREILK